MSPRAIRIVGHEEVVIDIVVGQLLLRVNPQRKATILLGALRPVVLITYAGPIVLVVSTISATGPTGRQQPEVDAVQTFRSSSHRAVCVRGVEVAVVLLLLQEAVAASSKTSCHGQRNNVTELI